MIFVLGEQERFRVHHLAQDNCLGIEKFDWKSDLSQNIPKYHYLVFSFLSELCWLWLSKLVFFSFFPFSPPRLAVESQGAIQLF